MKCVGCERKRETERERERERERETKEGKKSKENKITSNRELKDKNIDKAREKSSRVFPTKFPLFNFEPNKFSHVRWSGILMYNLLG